MAKPDYALKSLVLRDYSEILIQQRKVALAFFRYGRYVNFGEPMQIFPGDYTYEQAFEINDTMLKECPALWKECERINHAYYERVKRLKQRIETMLNNGKNLFLTLTFTDKTLAKTSDETRRRYVARFLKQFDCEYVANIDFGEENEREHYHAVLNTSFINPLSWQYGNLDVKQVRNATDKELDCIRLAKYVAKLTNHAIKETTKRNSLIYSRKR